MLWAELRRLGAVELGVGADTDLTHANTRFNVAPAQRWLPAP